MSFDWSKYLTVANDLVSKNTSDASYKEACSRAAVSRAYYAAFCSCRNFARDLEAWKPNNDGTDHTRVRAHFDDTARDFGQKGNIPQKKNRKAIRENLSDLHKNRKIVDYKDVCSDPLVVAQASIKLAEDIFELLERIKPKSNP